MKPITLTAVEYLTLNMREIDAREIYGLRGHDDPLLLAREVVIAATYGKAGIAEHKGRPCGIMGVSPLWPGVWAVWAFGTEEWAKGVIEISRFGRRVIDPFLRERGAHRAQCESHIEHSDAHRWLGVMGATCEGVLKGYGRDGADYLSFSWSKAHVLRKTARA